MLILWYFRKASSPFRPWLLHFKTRIVVCCLQKFRKPYFWITVYHNLLNANLAKTIFLLTTRFSYLAPSSCQLPTCDFKLGLYD